MARRATQSEVKQASEHLVQLAWESLKEGRQEMESLFVISDRDSRAELRHGLLLAYARHDAFKSQVSQHLEWVQRELEILAEFPQTDSLKKIESGLIRQIALLSKKAVQLGAHI